MAVTRDYLDYVLEQLAALSRVRPRRMFGGVGLYSDEVFFAIITDDTVYLRVDEASRADFVARGMGAFRPYADRPEVSMTYFEVPADVLEDAHAFVSWSQRAVAAALAAAKARPSPAPKRARRAKPKDSSGSVG
jgi:DNA transformation protein and related proteins